MSSLKMQDLIQNMATIYFEHTCKKSRCCEKYNHIFTIKFSKKICDLI